MYMIYIFLSAVTAACLFIAGTLAMKAAKEHATSIKVFAGVVLISVLALIVMWGVSSEIIATISAAKNALTSTN